MIIREEYVFKDIADYLFSSNDLLIAGIPNTEERSRFFFNAWADRCKNVLLLHSVSDGKMVYQLYRGQNIIEQNTIDLCIATSRLLRYLRVDEKNVLLDMSSLDHVLIMFLTKQLITQVVPKTLFAAYICPDRYCQQSGNVGFSLCNQVLAVNSVPGFTKRESEKQTLCSFLGFEGIRLKSILESVYNIDKFIPVVAFPSGAPQWYNVTMWNSMDTLQSENRNYAIRKCFSDSVFDAVSLLKENILPDEKAVLAPLGTRAHSMACATYL